MKVYDVAERSEIKVGERPRPQPDQVSAPYWQAAANGELIVQRCTSCGGHQFYPRPHCIHCGGEPEWTKVDERGEVYSFTVIRQNLAPPFAELGQYVLAMIDLVGGARLMGNVTDVDPDQVEVGMEVEAYAVRIDDQIGLPFWRPTQ